MCKLFVAMFAAVLTFVVPQGAWAVDSQPKVIIVELQTGTQVTGTEEFVEIYNASEQEVNVTGWLLQYRSATSTGSWATKRQIACEPAQPECNVVLAARGRLVLASYDIAGLGDEQPMSGGFADAGGQVRLVDTGPTSATNDDLVQDMLGYGTAVEAEGGLAAPKPPAGKSLKRLVSEDGYFIDTNVNGADWFVGCSDPTPGSIDEPLQTAHVTCEQPDSPPPANEEPVLEEPEAEEPADTETPPAETDEPGQGGGPIVYLPVLITELLPDPEAPSQDSTDEFIELFNPNTEPVDLAGYQLQSGSNYRYKYVLPRIILQPGQYMAITSEESGLTLSNSGTTVRLLSPDGAVQDELTNYGKSVEGQSWSKAADGSWVWSTTLTPGQANVVTLPPPKATKALAATKKSTTAKKSTTKPKVASVSKAGSSATSNEDLAYEDPPQAPNYWLLASVGSMALGYGLYEYREGIGGGLRKLWLVARGKGAAD